ncbi:MAG: Hpt domain-containing protein [Sedimentisphaerales bacterium]|nr:Hpt domain-containing protein [Sedimentisphaerales bacterium]
MERLLKLLEESSVKLLTVEPDDLAILAELHTNFEDLAKCVEELNLIDSEQEIISSTSLDAANLIQDIVLQEVADGHAAINKVSMTVKSLQEMLDVIEKGGDVKSYLESRGPEDKSAGVGAESPGEAQEVKAPPVAAKPEAKKASPPARITIELPENVDEDIFNDFVSGLSMNLDGLETAILDAEQDCTLEKKNHIKGKLHNLKGESSLMGLQQMATICHDSESLLEDIDGPFPGQHLLEACDQLRKMAAVLRGEESIVDVETHTEHMEAIDALEELINIADEKQENTAASVTPVAQVKEPAKPQVKPAASTASKPADQPASSKYVEAKFDSLVIAETDVPLVIDFVTESREHLEHAENDMLVVEENPEDQEAINSIFRAFHTIKGVAGFLELKHIGSLAHVSETLLDMGRKGQTVLENSKVDVIFEAIDLMKRMLTTLSEAVANNQPVHPVDGLGQLIIRIQMCIDGQEPVAKVGEILREKGEIKRTDLNEALKEQRDEPEPAKKKIGEILVEKEKTTEQKVDMAVAEQKRREQMAQGKVASKKIGELLIEKGFVSQKQIDEALTSQKNGGGQKKIGELLLEQNLVTREQIELVVREQKDQMQQMQQASRPTTAGKKQAAETTVKVTTERLDALINMVGELVIAQAMVSQDLADHRKSNQRLERNTRHLEKITRDLQELSMSTRMVPVQGVFQKMARLVRDLSRKSNKQIDFEMFGSETELDRNVVEEIADPLVHMIRNSVDHGVETPEDRRAAGKTPTGKISLGAYHKGGNIVIEIKDDGKGLSRERIMKKAIENGIIREDAEMTDQEVFRLIFHAGLSTAEKVTDISGRGVGMDVVRKNIESLRGRIDIDSISGQGTTFSIQLPLTLAVIEGQLVTVGSERYIIPTSSIEQNLRPIPKQISTVQGGRGEMMMVRGELIPLLRLYTLFGITPEKTDPCDSLVVIVSDGVRRCCIQVDDLLGQQQVVIKSLGDYLGTIKGVSGGAIMGDGNVSLILDVPGVLALAHGQ